MNPITVHRRSLRTRILFALAHLLLVTLAVRPLHFHSISSTTEPTIERAQAAVFCFDCTFGGDHAEFTPALAPVETVALSTVVEDVDAQLRARAATTPTGRAPPSFC